MENEVPKIERRKPMPEIERCPKCGGKSTGEIFYSLPKQTKCSLCGHVYCFGEGLEMIPHKEAGRIRNWKPDPDKKYPKRYQLDMETGVKIKIDKAKGD